MIFLLMVVGLSSYFVHGEVSPLDIEFRRQAVRRLVFDESQKIPLASCRPKEIVNLETEHPASNLAGVTTTYQVEGGRLGITAKETSRSALWVGGFNPFATYDVSFSGDESNSGEGGVLFASMEQENQVEVRAGFVAGECRFLRWRVLVEGEVKQQKKIPLSEPISGDFRLRVQLLGSGLNVFVVQDGRNEVVSTHDFSKLIDLRRKQYIRSFDFYLSSNLQRGERLAIAGADSALTTGAGQADICNITYEDGSPYFEDGRLWFTMSVRGRHLPHPLQGVFSLNPSVFDVRFDGIIVFDRGDGLLRNEVASHLFYDRAAQQWRGLTVGFSSYGDFPRKVPKQLWAVSSQRDPRFGFSIMQAKTIEMPGAEEDPHIIYDREAEKWRVLVCIKGGPGFPATLFEAEQWDGPYELIAGPAEVNGTGCLLQKIGSEYYAMFGSADQSFYVYSYPELKPLGSLQMERPPWSGEENARCWPNVVPLPEGYPAPYLALSMDRANYTDLKGWTYGALYLYYGYPSEGERAKYEYD